MRFWLTPTLLCAFSLVGCLAHERPSDEPDAGAGVDAALPPPDASAGRDAVVADAGPTCTLDERSVEVRIEPVTLEVLHCEVTHVEGANLMAIEAAPADDGIRLHFDFCPTAGADCRCDVVVSNVGTDLAATLLPNASVTLEVATGSGFFPGALVSITKTPTCECAGCGCGEPLYLYAASAPPGDARAVPAPMTFSLGAPICGAVDCTFGGSWWLHAAGDAGEVDVPGGSQRDLGSVHVRALRDTEMFAPCAACAGCATPLGAWVAWVDG